MSIKWPESMPEGGRLSQSKTAWQRGRMLVVDPKMSCPQTLHVTLFFDGTNNNDAEENKIWRDSKANTHTNVARLYNAAIDKPMQGIFKMYIPGVGTPFPKIGEDFYSQDGKALAAGFDNRCVWAYTRLLNSVYSAIATSKKQLLIDDKQARKLCDAHATVMESFQPSLHRLDVAHTQAVDEGRYPQTVRQIWVNVIGFSRGAAEARAFVHKLIREWAPGGRLGASEGKYALPYTVNFMGLFDTVAAVGLPDSVRSMFNYGAVAGHSTLPGVFRHGGMAFAANGAMNIPAEVRYCHHAFSIHEQRMSFALDSIRTGSRYSDDDFRVEVAYPGVHSDVGGGYAPGEQGKACGSNGKGLDACKLSQIPLHDMYIAALERGVPLYTLDTMPALAAGDFEIAPATIEKFNAWLTATPGIHTLEDAMRFGMRQLLAWLTLRAQIGTGYYVTEQTFYRRAQEDAKSPVQVRNAVEQACKTDPQYRDLSRQLNEVRSKNQFNGGGNGVYSLSQIRETQEEIKDLEAKQKKRIEEMTGEIAHPDAPPGERPNTSRPGEAPADIATNDKRDLRCGAEEMRLLLGYLNPEQRARWAIDQSLPVKFPRVKHAAPSDSPEVSMVERGMMSRLNGGITLAAFSPTDDFVLQPVEDVLPFMRESTSDESVGRLLIQHDVVALYDDLIHDSRCWFKVPWFREYAPGGYFWPRVVFVGDDERARWLGIDPLKVAVELNSGQGVDSGVDVSRVEIA